jgi:hypothetical protein
MQQNEDYKEQFIKHLEQLFGLWNRTTSRFGSTSFGEISKSLSISPSQFTKLISGTATEGMYSRSQENINRLIRHKRVQEQLSKLDEEHNRLKESIRTGKRSKGLLYILGMVSFTALGILLSPFILQEREAASDNTKKDHPLTSFFDKHNVDEYNSPYLALSEIQDYCPCSAFEGVWSLAENYKLPIPGTRKPGLYYTSKLADVRMKCSRNDSIAAGQGRVLLGYEYLINEIWIDTELRPLTEEFFDKDSKAFTQQFKELDFEKNERFKKVAVINSFFIDRFEIFDNYILRKGEPCGRYASDIDQELTKEFNIDIEYILTQVLSNLTTTACQPAINHYCNPNDLDVGDIISFDCLYTIETENLGIGGGYPYTKAYKLEEQIYADNLTCSCGEAFYQ